MHMDSFHSFPLWLPERQRLCCSEDKKRTSPDVVIAGNTSLLRTGPGLLHEYMFPREISRAHGVLGQIREEQRGNEL
jgi:hypothetical protein